MVEVPKACSELNQIRREFLNLSNISVFDETMSAWCPQTSFTGGLPNISNIQRKPEPLGTEAKSAVSGGDLRVMRYLEIMKGKEGQKSYPWHKELGAGASCLKRLALGVDDSYKDSYKSYIIADSWFGSVKGVNETAMADGQKREVLCNVKTAHALFPKEYMMKALEGMPGGVHIVLKGTHPVSGLKLVAVGYKYNRKNTRLFVATEGAGSTTPGTPYEMKFHNDEGNIQIYHVDRSEIVSFYYKNANANDVLNHLRQGCLKLEKKWLTKSAYFSVGNNAFRYLYN